MIFFIPARGRKLWYTQNAAGGDRIFFIPARGRKRLAVNPVPLLARIFFIPARGRKQSYSKIVQYVFDFLYPREGTETLPPFFLLLLSSGFSLSPRGDGNNRLHVHRYLPPRFSLSPRGDGNSPTVDVAHTAPDFLYPREGTETQHSNVVAVTT